MIRRDWRVEFWSPDNKVWRRSETFPSIYSASEAGEHANTLRYYGLKHVRAVYGFASISEPPADAVASTPGDWSAYLHADGSRVTVENVFILTRTDDTYVGVFKTRDAAALWLGQELLADRIDLEMGSFALTEVSMNSCGFKVQL